MQHFCSFVSQACHWPFPAGIVRRICHCCCPPFSAGHVAFLFICLPGLSLVVSASFSWPCSISAGVRPFSVGHVAFLFIPQVCHWWCPPLDAGHVAFLCSFVSQVCHWRCPPLSVGHAAFLFICLPGLSLLVSALFRCRCNISIRLSPRSVTGGVRPFPLFLFICFPCLSRPTQHFYSFVPQACHWWCPPFSAVSIHLLPGLSLLVSALFRWPCSISIHLSPRSVTASVRWPCSISIHLPGLSLLVSALVHWPCCISIHVPPRIVTGGVRDHVAFLFFCLPGLSLVCPCLLAMKHFYSFVPQVRHCWCHVAFLFICLSGLSLVVSALFGWACSISIHLFPGSVTGAALFRYSFVSHVCRC